MVDRGKISAMQLAFLMYPVIIATGDLTAPVLTVKFAGRDLWISPFIASFLGFIIVFIVNQLHKWYPGKTMIQYMEDILGTVFGKLLGALLVMYCLYSGTTVLRQYFELIAGGFLPETPVIVISASMVLVCSFAVRGGGEVLARLSQVIVPVIFLSWIIIFVLLLPDMKLIRMLPVMEKGIQPALMGAVPLLTWFDHFWLLSFFLPMLNERQKGLKWSLIAVVVVTLVLTAINLMVLLIFGSLTSSLTYPAFAAVRYISIASFLTRLESVVMALWVAGAFLKLSIFYYGLTMGAAQWLKLRDHHSLIFPMGILLALYSIWISPSLQEFAHFMSTSNIFFNYSIEMAIPMFVFAAAVIRRIAARDGQAALRRT